MEKAIKNNIPRIAIVGPESTGKTTLAMQLAQHYNTEFVPEYARNYIDKLERPYNVDDITEIAKQQMKSEDEIALKAGNLLFCDTDLIVTKIWAEHKYGYCPEWILSSLMSRKYSLYLLCNIDIPWQPDPQREHPHLREHLFEKYQMELASQTTPYIVISGLGNTRTANAIKAVDTQLSLVKS